MLQIVIPMAGQGSRFLQAGYTDPKPLIPIHGVPMLELVVSNVRPQRPHRFIFLCLKEHLERMPIRSLVNRIAPGALIVEVDSLTEGAACTVLLAKSLINNEYPLMIANSDQWVDYDINTYLAEMDANGVDGLIMTMPESDPKWSYVKFDGSGEVSGVFEKKVVSNEATVGIYNFKRGKNFVEAAELMIERNDRVNGEFYVAPVYNYFLELGHRAVCHNIKSNMYGLGIPNDLESFVRSDISHKAVAHGLQS